MFNSRVGSVSMLLSIFIGVGAAHAGTITTYSDRGMFIGDAPPLAAEVFTDARRFPILSGQLNSETDETFADGPPIMPGDLRAGATYSTLVDDDHIFSIDFGGGYNRGFLDALALNGSKKAPLVIDFHEEDPMTPRSVSAFGFDMGSLRNGGSTTLVITFDDASQQTFDLDYPINLNIEFFGFISDEADIASVSIINNGSTSTSFDIDNVLFSAVDCAPDFFRDGMLDFFDMSTFVTLYTEQDPSADLNNDGAFDFFDVSAFLTLFGNGCP